MTGQPTVTGREAPRAFLESLHPEQARPHIPPYVAGQHVQFVRCPVCNRIFWPGTHWEYVRLTLENLRQP